MKVYCSLESLIVTDVNAANGIHIMKHHQQLVRDPLANQQTISARYPTSVEERRLTVNRRVQRLADRFRAEQPRTHLTGRQETGR